MLTPQEIAAFRKDGFSDDEILSALKGRDKAFASDIESFQKEGFKSSEIIDTVVPKWKPADTKTDASFTSSAAHGAASVLSGIGNTIDKSSDEGGIWKTLGRGLAAAGKAITPDAKTFKPASSSIKWNEPSTWTEAPRALVEMAPGLATDVAAGAVGTAVGGPIGGFAGFTGSSTARNYGNNVDDRMGYQGKTAEAATSGDKAAALGGAVGEALLSRIGLGKLGGGIGGALTSRATGASASVIPQIAGQMGRAAAGEAAMSVPGSVANQIGRTAGTEKGLSIDPNEVANEALLGGLAGGAIRGTRGIGDGVDTVRLKKAGLGADPEADAKAVSEIQRSAETKRNGDADLSNPSKSYDAVKGAEIRLDQELNDASKGAKAYIGTLDGEVASRVETAISSVKAGRTLTKSERSEASKSLSNDAEGQTLLNAIRARSSLNAIQKLGNTSEGKITGGLAETGIVRGIDKLAIPSAITGYVLGNPIGATAAAVRPAARVLDMATGVRNPVEMAANRLGGNLPSVDPNLPSQLREDEGRVVAEQAAIEQAKAEVAARKVADREARSTRREQNGVDRGQRREQRDADIVARLIAQMQGMEAAKASQPDQPTVVPKPRFASETEILPPRQQQEISLPPRPPVEGETTFPNSALTDRGTLRPEPGPVDAEAGAHWRDDTVSKQEARQAEKADGETFDHDGLTFPIPADVRSKPHYVNAARHLQNRVNEHLARAYNDGQIEQATFNAIEAARKPLKLARTKEDALAVVDGLKASADSADRPTIERVFDSFFLDQWSKLKAAESRYAGSDD